MKSFGNKEMEGCEYLKRPSFYEIDHKLSNGMYFLTLAFFVLGCLQFRLLDLRGSFTIKHQRCKLYDILLMQN